MAEVRQQKLVCPQCKRELTIDVWDKVELPYDLLQRDRVLQNTFFKVNCSGCQSVFTIAYKCQYNDMERKYLLWVAPAMDEKEQKEIADYNLRLETDERLRLAQGGYRYRIVRNDNELREKVVVFDEGLDDRYIETLKIVYVPLIKKKMGEGTQITGIYFDRKKTGGYQFIVTFDNKPPMSANVNMDIYHDMTDKLKSIAERNTPEGLCRIDADWGLKVMMHEVEA